MRRLVLMGTLAAGLLVVWTVPAQAQEQQQQQEPENTLGPWKIANTLLFAIALGWFLYRSAPKFFNARSSDIQKAIQDATGLKIQADFRYSEVDRKMATLAEEVNRMRDASAAEMEREHQRVRRETEMEMARLRQNVRNEIEAFRKEGMRQVRQRTAEAAIARTEQRLRSRPETVEPDDLLQDFVHVVERGRK